MTYLQSMLFAEQENRKIRKITRNKENKQVNKTILILI